MNKNKLLTVISVIIVLVIFCSTLLFIYKEKNSKIDGTITFEYVNINEDKSCKKVTFKKGDTIEKILTENFNNVLFDGTMLISFEDFNMVEENDYFLMVYVNDKESNVGLKQIEITDGIKISLKVTKISYEW